METCQAERGTLAVCIREAQRTLAQSSKRLIESKIATLGVGSQFKLFNDKIETPGDGLIIFRGMRSLGDEGQGCGGREASPAGATARHGPHAGRTRVRGSANVER